MRVISVNVNGIRSAARKGFYEWLGVQCADFVCMQEIKAHEADLPDPILKPARLHAHFHSAAKKGYSGVGLHISKAFCPERPAFEHPAFDYENRIVGARLPQATVVSS